MITIFDYIYNYYDRVKDEVITEHKINVINTVLSDIKENKCPLSTEVQSRFKAIIAPHGVHAVFSYILCQSLASKETREYIADILEKLSWFGEAEDLRRTVGEVKYDLN